MRGDQNDGDDDDYPPELFGFIAFSPEEGIVYELWIRRHDERDSQ